MVLEFNATTWVMLLAITFMIVALMTKQTWMTITSGLAWIATSIFTFSQYYAGGATATITMYALGWITLLAGFSMLFSSWWTHRHKTEQIQGKGENFYSEEDPDFKDINDIYNAREARRKLRGR